jgi:hypothetical protein
MYLALHYWKKDSIRLRWEIAAVLVLLSALSLLDSARVDSTPGAPEGWLNILLSAAWSILVARAVQADPLVGDRQFWVTSPCPWTSLLAAKLLFAFVWVQVPYLIACVFILASRGFNAFLLVPQLMWKQLAVVLVVTLPSMAVATLVKNTAQFAVVLLAASAVAVWQSIFTQNRMAPYLLREQALPILPVLLLALGAVSVLLMQYFRRCTLCSRLTGLGTVLAAMALSTVWSPKASALFSASLMSADRLPVSLAVHSRLPLPALPPELLAYPRARGDRVLIAVPIDASGFGASSLHRFAPLSLELVTPVGDRFSAKMRFGARSSQSQPLEAFFFGASRDLAWQVLIVDPSLYQRISDRPVKLEADFLLDAYRQGEPVRLEHGSGAFVSSRVRCFSELREAGGLQGALTVVCESPHPLPPTMVELSAPANAEKWRRFLGDSSTSYPWPTLTWLSPVQRRQTAFPVVPRRHDTPGSRWLVPSEALSGATVAVSPGMPLGCGVVTLRAANLSLASFVVGR